MLCPLKELRLSVNNRMVLNFFFPFGLKKKFFCEKMKIGVWVLAHGALGLSHLRMMEKRT